MVGELLVAALLAAAHTHPELLVDPVGCNTTFRFSPRGGADDFIVSYIFRAEYAISVAAYGLNDPKIVDALIAADRRGVAIRIKLDRLQSTIKGQKAQIARMRRAGLVPEISKMSRIMHHKFMVIDSHTVITGSYNFTTSAQDKNRENVVVLNCPEVAEKFDEEWSEIE